MKTIALVSLVLLAGLLLVTTIHAAPSCCDPKQGQAPQSGLFPIVPQAGNTAPVAPRNTYRQQAQPPMTYFPAAAVPVQRAIPQTNPVAAASGPCGCGAHSKTANYQVSTGSCCGGNASYGRAPAMPQAGSLPSCCSGKTQAAAPVPGCCAGQMKPATSAPNCCAVGPKSEAPAPNCCAGQVKAAAPSPNCCAVGPKTAAPALQVPKGTGKAASSHLPLHAQPAVVQAAVPSNLFSAMKITTNGTPVPEIWKPLVKSIGRIRFAFPLIMSGKSGPISENE